jgi:hypothetical protein
MSILCDAGEFGQGAGALLPLGLCQTLIKSYLVFIVDNLAPAKTQMVCDLVVHTSQIPSVLLICWSLLVHCLHPGNFNWHSSMSALRFQKVGRRAPRQLM